MTVPTTSAFTGPYYPNGVTVEYPFGFKVNYTDEVTVFYLEDDGTETIVASADYTVVLSTNENNPGGTVTTAAPLPDSAGKPLYIALDPEFTQGTKFEDEGAFNQSILNPTFDAGALRSIWLRSRIERAFIAPFGEVGLTMPRAAERANFFFSFDATGKPFLSPGTGADAGLRQALAQPDALVLLPAVDTALQGKAPVSTKSSAANSALYPVDMRLGTDAQPHPFEYITNNAVRNAIRAGTSTTDVSAELQQMLNDWKPDLGKAGIIDFPIGRYALGAPLQFPSWVGWRGFGRGTQLYALPGHTGPYMFQFDSDPAKVIGSPVAYFNSFLQGFDINANAVAAITWVVYAPSWNEKCGLRDVMARSVENGFLLIDEWHGGSSGFVMDNVEIFTTANAHTNNRIAISLVGKTRAGALIGNKPIVTMTGVTIAGATAGVDGQPGMTMIKVDNVDLDVQGSMHFERALQGILVKNNGNLRGGTLSGSDAGGRVCDLVVRDSDHTGQIDIAVSLGTGTLRALRDYKAGAPGNVVITAPVGGQLTVPSLPGQAIADGVFAVGGGAITSSTLRGCSGVVRSAAGYYQVTLSDNMPGGASNDNYYVVAEAHDDAACYVNARRSERTAGTFFLRAQGEANDALADPVQVTFRVYRKPGL